MCRLKKKLQYPLAYIVINYTIEHENQRQYPYTLVVLSDRKNGRMNRQGGYVVVAVSVEVIWRLKKNETSLKFR